MAVESEHVTATIYEATEFPDLIARYDISGVPKTVVNERIDILGALPEAQFVPQIVGDGAGRKEEAPEAGEPAGEDGGTRNEN